MAACGRIGICCSFRLRQDEAFCTLSARSRRGYVGGGTGGFSDNGHLKYYHTPRVRCGAKTVEEKRRKIMKKLAKDLTALVCLEKEKEENSQVVAATETGNQDMADVLLAQLKELRTQETTMVEEEKDIKKKKKKEEKAAKKMKKNKKEEKAAKKMMKKEKEKKAMTKMQDCKDKDMSSSSSESSESSDSECDEVVDIASMRVTKLVTGQQSMPRDTTNPTIMFENDLVHRITEHKSIVTSLLNHPSESCETSPTSVLDITRPEGDLVVTIPAAAAATPTMPMNRIEVCMGGKCKRSGALQLKEEFERYIGVEGEVVGCKCMGKCKEGPNVRVVNQCSVVEPSMPLPRNPLCIGVSLEDVGNIMASYFGKNGASLVSTT